MIKKLLALVILNILISIIISGLANNVSAAADCCETFYVEASPESLFKKEECKEIIAMNPMTAGEYNLHMKVRDPSRHGVQVLFICEPGYQYTYHHPQTGESMDFTIEHRIIGTTSINDKPPEIMKPGMVLTSSGISYGTNDCPSLMYTNPSKYAWDDFDWIRYAYQTAETEDEAVELLTKDAVDELHATCIGETLYVVGPNKGFAIEADANNYHVEEIKDIYIKSNYPEFLWDVCSSDQYKYAPQFETKFDDWAREFQVIKLGVKCTLGITIKRISSDSIIAKAFPGDGEEVTINKGENKSVGNFRVGLIATSGFSDSELTQLKRAHVTICYKYLEWRDHVYELVNEKRGEIILTDFMNWSRLHSEELDGLRGFCEGGPNDEESVNIFKHQLKEPELMSSLWFSGIPCSSIYVPIHICAKDIYEPYKTGEVWGLTLELLENYDHGTLQPVLENIEEVFIVENDEIESIGYELLYEKDNSSVIDLLTYSNNMLQCHAYKMMQILLNLSQITGSCPIYEADEGTTEIIESINNMWSENYFISLNCMKKTIARIKEYRQKASSDASSENTNILTLFDNVNIGVLYIMGSAAYHKINEAECVVGEKNSDLKACRKIYQEGVEEIKQEHFTEAADKFIQAFEIANCLVLGKPYDWEEESPIWTTTSYLILSGVIILVVIFCAMARFRKKRKSE